MGYSIALSSGPTLEKFAHRVPGFALDAKQVDGQWLVLSCSIDPEGPTNCSLRYRCTPIASPKSKPKTAG